MQPSDPALSAHGLACSRGARELFSGLSFTLRAAELLLIQGGNGQGKTSLLRLLTGLSQAEHGEVRWRGEKIGDLRQDYHREMAYIGHLNGIKEDLTPIENLKLSAHLGGRALDEDRAASALKQLGLARCPDLPCRALSFGQRRRVALAGLLCTDALLWILDEPLTGLDAGGVAMVERMLKTHLDHGGLAVLTTHQPITLPNANVSTLHVGNTAS